MPGHTNNPSLDEAKALISEKSPSTQYAVNSSSSGSRSTMSWTMRVWMLVKEEPVALLAVLFVIMFNQTAIEVEHTT